MPVIAESAGASAGFHRWACFSDPAAEASIAVIRSEELAAFFDTALQSVRYFKDELQSEHAKKDAAYLIQALERLVAQRRHAPGIAAREADAWRRLAADFPFGDCRLDYDRSLTDTALPLEHDFIDIQSRMRDSRWHLSWCKDLEDHGSSATSWLARAVSASHRLWEETESGVPINADGNVAEWRVDPTVLAANLNKYFAEKFSDLPGSCVLSATIPAEGSSKITALLSLRPNPRFPERIVLRQDVRISITDAAIEDEFPILERVFRLGLPVPEPLLLECDHKFLGAPFMLMTEIARARPAGTYFPKERRYRGQSISPELVLRAARDLALLHKSTRIDRPVASQGADREALLEKAYARWLALPKPPYSLVVDLAFAWLKAHPLQEPRPRCLVHGDYGLHNMLVRDGCLAAILDWELARDDDPAIDLAECMMLMVEDVIPWSRFVEEYLSAGGDPRACDPKAVAYHSVWFYSARYALWQAELRNAYFKAARTDARTASGVTHSIDRVYQYLARALMFATEQLQF